MPRKSTKPTKPVKTKAKAPAKAVKAKRQYKPRSPKAITITAPTPDLPYAIGTNVLIRTVTMFHVGKVAKVTDKFIVLEQASWIGDTGRWGDALKNGTLSEVEPFPKPVAVAIDAIVDVTEWDHALPTAQIPAK